MSFSNKKIKYCAITTVTSTMDAFVVKAMEYLSDHGYEVTLVCDMDDDFIDRYSDRFSCINIPMKRGMDPITGFLATWKMYKLFREKKFDVVQYATPNASLYASIATNIARIQKRVYCQWGIRYVGFSGYRRHFYRFLEYIICHLSTHIRPASNKNLQFAVGEKLYSPKKANVVGSGGTIGVDLSIFDINLKVDWRNEVRDELSLNGKVVFGFVGSLRPDKGINELFLAFKKILELRKDSALLLCGDELDLDPIDHDIRTWAHVCPDVHFVGHVKETWRYMAGLDVLVHPSYREGFSMVIQEAASLALPVITTNIPGPSEVIEEEVTGLLVPHKEVDALSAAMLRMLDNPDMRVQMGNAGLNRVKTLFTRELMLQYTLDDRNAIVGREN